MTNKLEISIRNKALMSSPFLEKERIRVNIALSLPYTLPLYHFTTLPRLLGFRLLTFTLPLYHFTTLPRLLLSMVLGFVLLHPTLVQGAFSKKSAGTSGASFLKIGVGARPTAMGEAFTGVADDVNTVYYNPGGLATLKKNEFVAMRAEMFQDINYNFFAFAHPTESWGTFAIAINNLNITDIEKRTGDTDTPDSKFSSNDTAYTLAYAMKLTMMGLPSQEEEGGLHLGVSVKAIRQTLSSDQANSVAGDAGLLYRGINHPFAVGAAVQNAGMESKFKNVSDPLPLTIKVGTSYRLGEDWMLSGLPGEEGQQTGLLLAVDGHFPRDYDPSARAGTEFTFGWTENLRTSLRGGYQSDRQRQIADQFSGVTAGAGLTYKFISFDFAWMPFGDLGNTFRYSVKLRF